MSSPTSHCPEQTPLTRPKTGARGTDTHSRTHQNTESVLPTLICQLPVSAALQLTGSVQYQRVCFILSHICHIVLRGSRHEQAKSLPQGRANVAI